MRRRRDSALEIGSSFRELVAGVLLVLHGEVEADEDLVGDVEVIGVVGVVEAVDGVADVSDAEVADVAAVLVVEGAVVVVDSVVDGAVVAAAAGATLNHDSGSRTSSRKTITPRIQPKQRSR